MSAVYSLAFVAEASSRELFKFPFAAVGYLFVSRLRAERGISGEGEGVGNRGG